MSSVPLDLQPQVSFLKGALLLTVDVGTALCLRSHAKSGCTKKSYCKHH